MNKNVIRGLVSVGALSIIGAAQAAAIDVSAVTSGIGEYSAGATSPIVLIGGAILLVVLTIKAIGWVRSSMK